MRRLLLFAAAAAALAGCATPAAEAPRTYANPVLDTDFPDPAVLRAADGWFYAYATQGSGADGAMRNIQVARSRDLLEWEQVGDALPVKPGWASRTQDFWAPHVHGADGRYFLYYSAKPDAALTDETRGLCLAVATAERPEGPSGERAGRRDSPGPAARLKIGTVPFFERGGRRLKSTAWKKGTVPLF